MKIKLSDFILENSIDTDATVDDIQFEQTVAKLNVAFTMLEYYMKQLQMGADFFQEVEADVPKEMPTADDFGRPTTSVVQSYDDTNNIASIFKNLGLEQVTSTGSGARGYLQVFRTSGRDEVSNEYDMYKITYQVDGNGTPFIDVKAVDIRDPETNKYSKEQRFEIDNNKGNIKRQIGMIVNQVKEDTLDRFENTNGSASLKDYIGAKKNNKSIDRYDRNKDYETAVNNAADIKKNAAATIMALCTYLAAILNAMRLFFRIVISVYNKLMKIVGKQSNNDIDQKALTMATRSVSHPFKSDVLSGIQGAAIVLKTSVMIDKMQKALTAIDLLMQENNAMDRYFWKIATQYQNLIQNINELAEIHDKRVKDKIDANWVDGLKTVLESDKSRQVQKMIQSIDDASFKRQIEQSLQGIDKKSIEIIIGSSKRLNGTFQRDITNLKQQYSQLSKELDEIITTGRKAKASEPTLKPLTSTTQPRLKPQQPQQQTPPPQQQGGQVMQMQ